MAAVKGKKTLPELEIPKKFKGIDDSILQNIMAFNGNFHGKIRTILENDKVYNKISKFINKENWRLRCNDDAQCFIEIPVTEWMLDDLIKEETSVEWCYDSFIYNKINYFLFMRNERNHSISLYLK